MSNNINSPNFVPEPNITIIENFINNPDELFIYIRDNVIWDERIKARKTASFGVSYNYSGITYPKIAMLKELEDAGELEKTIIVWYTDHGGPLPRQKRLLYDSGMRLPLIVSLINLRYE